MPVKIVTGPLAPDDRASLVVSSTDPDPDEELLPDVRRTAPPIPVYFADPADINRSPPLPAGAVERPAVSQISPPAADVESPTRMLI
ncbi:MAG: hypothetical protein ACK56I_21460, partial [bacterium]